MMGGEGGVSSVCVLRSLEDKAPSAISMSMAAALCSKFHCGGW